METSSPVTEPDYVETPPAGDAVEPQAAGPPKSLLDTPVLEMFDLNLEIALYAVLAIIGVLTRFWDLGARVISHDESLHALYSWKLYAGQGYQHNPMMHGPFLFHANALMYALFGDNDFTSRIVPALFGVALIVLPYFLRKWLGRTGALVAAVLLTISPNVLYYSRYIRDDIYLVTFSMVMVIALFKFLDEHKNKWLYIGATALMLSILSMEATYIIGFIGLTFIVLAAVWEYASARWRRILRWAGLALALVLLAGGAALLATGGSPAPNGTAAALREYVQYLLVAAFLLFAALFASIIYDGSPRQVLSGLRAVSLRAIVITLLVVLIPFALLSTTFFTNPIGLWTASGGAIVYWLEQHGVQRGGQPWYYYIYLLLPLYEFVPLLFSLLGMVYYLVKGVPGPEGRRRSLFVAFLIYWWVSALVFYSWAGEKMPWLVVHPVEPMILLAGRFMGDVIDSLNWREVRARGGLYLGLALSVLAIALVTVASSRPFQGMSIWKLQDTSQWLTAAIAAVVLLWIVIRYARRLGGRASIKVALVTALIVLSLGSIRFAWMASFINYDYTNEFLVYAHGGPDVKTALTEIEDISRRTVGDKDIKVAYDDDSTWPLEWYFREYKNRAYYGAQPSRESLDAPVVIVGDKNLEKVKPFLGKKYNQYRYRLVWWPIEDYKNLSFQGILDTLRDPVKRSELWDIIFYRKYQTAFNNWPYLHRFYMFVRKDVDSQVWGRGGAGLPGALQPEQDPYVQKQKQVTALLTVGQPGSEPGEMADPRGLAVDKAGNVFVADSNNHRIQKFDGQGMFLKNWGGQGPEVGQFQEPWGVAADAQGNVYVADTWNHRVQKFSPDGDFLLQWGTFGDTKGAPDGQPGVFWGPRAIAFDSQGNVYVTDTGNKRVQVFTPEGQFVRQFGQVGAGDGQFEEPVGIAIDPSDNIYVADTWNRRIQKFDSKAAYVAQWPVEGWESESIVNKPYLAADDKGHVFATDPEGYRVIEWSDKGELIATLGQFGNDTGSFNLPTGLAIDSQGNLWVSDSANQRIMKFGPLN